MKIVKKKDSIKALRAFLNYSSANIDLLESLVKDTEILISSKHTVTFDNLSFKEKAELRKNAAIFGVVEKNKKFNPKSDNVKIFLAESLSEFTKKNFLANMALTYLVILFENFVELQLRQVLFLKTSYLKNDKPILYKEIINLGSIEKIISAMVDKEIKNTLDSGIIGLGLLLENKFKIDIKSGFKDWEKIKEISLRRNLVVHNHGIQDEKYLKTMGYKKRVRLQTNLKYFYRSVPILKNFMLFLNKELSKLITV